MCTSSFLGRPQGTACASLVSYLPCNWCAWYIPWIMPGTPTSRPGCKIGRTKRKKVVSFSQGHGSPYPVGSQGGASHVHFGPICIVRRGSEVCTNTLYYGIKGFRRREANSSLLSTQFSQERKLSRMTWDYAPSWGSCSPTPRCHRVAMLLYSPKLCRHFGADKEVFYLDSPCL